MKVYICGNKCNKQAFYDAEVLLRKQGHVPINPIKILNALPLEINNSDFTVIAFEIIRISDAIYLLNECEKDLFSSMELSHAQRLEKEILYAA